MILHRLMLKILKFDWSIVSVDVQSLFHDHSRCQHPVWNKIIIMYSCTTCLPCFTSFIDQKLKCLINFDNQKEEILKMFVTLLPLFFLEYTMKDYSLSLQASHDEASIRDDH